MKAPPWSLPASRKHINKLTNIVSSQAADVFSAHAGRSSVSVGTTFCCVLVLSTFILHRDVELSALRGANVQLEP